MELLLKQLINRWNSLTHRFGDSAAIKHTPSGSMPVYVSHERCRFVIPTRFLNLPVFVTLLEKAEEDYGYRSTGGIVLPCDVVLFEAMLELLKRDERKFGRMGFDELLGLVLAAGCLGSCTSSSVHGFGATLLHKIIRA